LPSGNDGIFQVNVAVEEKELFFHKCFDVAFSLYIGYAVMSPNDVHEIEYDASFCDDGNT